MAARRVTGAVGWLAAGLAVGAGVLLAGQAPRGAAAAVPSELDQPALQFRIVLGASDTEERDWSGSLTVAGGTLRRVRPWHFEAEEKLTGEAAWQCATHRPIVRARRPFESHLPDRTDLWFNRPGLLVETSSDPGTEVRVHTAQGDFSFRAGEVPLGAPKAFLGDAARPGATVQRVPLSQVLPPDPGQSDYPAVAAAPDGTVWTSWQEYRDGKDRLAVRSMSGGNWSDPIPVPGAEGDLFGSAVAVDGRGRLRVVWSAQVEGNWDLYFAAWDGRAWSATERLTTDPQPDFFPRMAARNGRVALVWQGFRGGQSDIFFRRTLGDGWARELRISPSDANDWDPSVAVGADGPAVVAWDTYDQGNYDVLARTVTVDGPPTAPTIAGAVQAVAATSNFEAHATVTIDGANRTWIACDAGGPNWGKDTGFEWERKGLREGTRLYGGSQVRSVHVFVGEGTGYRGVTSPDALLTNNFSESNELPALTTDSEGQVWLFMRHRTMKDISLRGTGRGRNWEWYATTVSGDRWLPATYLPDSDGRNDMRLAAVPAKDRVMAVYVTDNRQWANAAPGHHDVVVAAIAPPAGRAKAALAQLPQTTTPPVPPIHPQEAAQVRRMREAVFRDGGESFHVYRGDMHRHTDISSDGGGDGSLLDVYRYALDAAAMDYLAVTDHQSGDGNEYTWWRGQKYADLFHVAGRFTPLFAYERSLPYPNGHRNVVFAQRGIRVLPFAPGETQGQVNSGSVLYPHLREKGGIAMSHTSATGMGTDWRDNDPVLEPLVEIFQGDRNNYEYEGAPHSPTAAEPGSQEGGFRPAGFVWNALAKGYRLGFQSSSDHMSTHLSYACLLASAPTREALLEAIRKRRAYAATDNILLDFRLRDGDREYLMGTEATVSSRPKLRIRVEGTGPLEEVAIIRSNRVAYAGKPESDRFDLEFTDQDAEAGGSYYYYVRVLQKDGQMAWASPVWVKWTP